MTIRGEILDKAKALTEGDRNEAYGDPYEGMKNYMSLLYAFGFNVDKTSHAVLALIALKLSRICANPKHIDSYVDLAAYVAIMAECVQREEQANA